MESQDSTQILDSILQSKCTEPSDLMLADAKSKVMTEELRLMNLSIKDSVYIIPIFPKEKKCWDCKKYKDDKKLW